MMEKHPQFKITDSRFFHPFFSRNLVLCCVLCLLLASCRSTIHLPEYNSFADSHSASFGAESFAEVYGSIQAKVNGKSVRASFNLLVVPGQKAYMEIISPEQQLLYAFSLDHEKIVLLWAQEKTYLSTQATAQNLRLVAGISALPDDLLTILSGFGLNFPKWMLQSPAKQGWILSRAPFHAEVTLKESLSRIQVSSPEGNSWSIRYEDYTLENNISLPTRMEIEIPAEKLKITMRIDKYVPRSETPSADLFQVELPAKVTEITLAGAYKGTPILLDLR